MPLGAFSFAHCRWSWLASHQRPANICRCISNYIDWVRLFGDVSSAASSLAILGSIHANPLHSRHPRLVAPAASLIRHIVDSFHILALPRHFRFSPITSAIWRGKDAAQAEENDPFITSNMPFDMCDTCMSKQLAFDARFFRCCSCMVHRSPSSSHLIAFVCIH